MLHLKEKYAKQIEVSRQRMAEAYAYENKRPVKYINDSAWWLFGEIPETLPDGYSTGNLQGMLDHQIQQFEKHFAAGYDDAMEPILSPWYGTAVLPSTFGLGITFKEKMDPAVAMPGAMGPEYVEQLQIPDMESAGLMKNVLETIDFFNTNCDLEINLTDCQGPLSSAFNLVGYDNFCYWIYRCPDTVHLLMDKVTDALIESVRAQKWHMGVPDDHPSSMMHIRGLEGKGGVFIADDDAVVINSKMYAEFAKPYNEKLFRAFGGGGIHCCGKVSHQIENFKNTEGLTIYHNMLLNNFDSAEIVQRGLAEVGIPYVAGDFNPADELMEDYYEELKRRLRPEGLILASYIAPATEMVGGKYNPARRDKAAVAKRINAIIDECGKKYYAPAVVAK